MIKNILLVLGAFVVGFLVNKNLKPSASTENPIQCENLSAAKNDLISISQNEYHEYTQIKDLKQKYEKADELLGKVMLLFLADMGFKISKIPLSELEVGTAAPENVTSSVEASKAVESTPVVDTAAEVRPAIAVQAQKSLEGKSTLIRNLKSEAQIKEALDKALIDNVKATVASGNPVGQQQMKVIEGSFAGEIKFFDKKREARNLTWSLVANYHEKPITTEFRLRMYGGGEGNSEASGRGELRHVSMLEEDPYAFMVETCGGSCYFQLYYNAIYDQFFGNYYESKKGDKKFERIGLVNLRR